MDGTIPSWQRLAQEEEAETREIIERSAKREEYSELAPGEDLLLMATVGPFQGALALLLWEAIGRFWWAIAIAVVIAVGLLFFLR
jgi:hypothetical protein